MGNPSRILATVWRVACQSSEVNATSDGSVTPVVLSRFAKVAKRDSKDVARFRVRRVVVCIPEDRKIESPIAFMRNTSD